MSTKELQEKLVARMETWQKLEKAAVTQTAKIMEQTDHPLIRAVAEIIQRDSMMHYRVQQLIIDSLEKESVPMLMDQLEKAWESIEQHVKLEKKTIEMAEASLKDMEGTRNVVQLYLIRYLLNDEQKHDKLLADLDLIKRKMFP
ncbi:MAG: hypothetical protein ACOY3Y_03100 [Acidobacteriota bacterium]|jgi:hypothetical protein